MKQWGIIHENHWLFHLPILRNYSAITLGNHLFFKGALDQKLYRHERIHLEQIHKIGVVKFYYLYLKYYLCGLWKLRSHERAYRENPFEVEAYNREDEP